MSAKTEKEKHPILDMEFTPAIGRIVHFVENNGTDAGIHRPALLSLDFNGKEMGMCVFQPQRQYFRLLKDTPRDEDKKAPNTWHVPERE